MWRAMTVVACVSACAGSVGCQDDVSLAATLASDEHGIRSITVGNDHVYWATSISGMIKRVHVDGGPIEVLVSEKQQLPDRLSLDTSHLYWTTEDNNIKRVARNGGEPELVINTATNLTSMAVDGAYLYWMTEGGALERIVKEDIVPLEPAPEPEAIVSSASYAGPMVVANSIYFVNKRATDNDSQVMWLAWNSNTPEPLTDSLEPAATPTTLATGPNNLFWASRGDDTVSWMPIDGGAGVATIDGGHNGLVAVAGDDDNVYWTSDDGTLSMAAIDGGAPQDIILGPKAQVQLAVDATSIYWANSATGTIRTKLKPVDSSTF